jgi:FkbM family methyltransferase
MKLPKSRIRRFRLYFEYYQYFGFSFIYSLIRNKKRKEARLFGRVMHYTQMFWFLHTLKEIFIDKVYQFACDTTDPYILDCGSNIGLSIVYFKQLFPAARIIGFEPDPINFSILSSTLKEFGLNDVAIYQKAIWKENGTLQFDSFGSVGSRLSGARTDVRDVVNVETVSLQSFLRNRVVDFLKLDIEGAELAVLESCAGELANVTNLFVEYHCLNNEEQRLPEILKIISKAGFRYYIKEAWENLKYPYVEKSNSMYEVQLNIFAYRLKK